MAHKATICSVFIIAAVITARLGPISSGGTPAPPTASNLRCFIDALEACPHFASTWDTVAESVKDCGVPQDIDLDSWKQLLDLSTRAGMKSRIALQTHPVCKKKAHFDLMVKAYGYDSDLFTRTRVYVYMVQLFPEDPRTPRFGLLLLLETWNSPWPDGIDLHGMSPREALSMEIGNLWTDVEDERITPERCGTLLSQSDRWTYDAENQQWSVKK